MIGQPVDRVDGRLKVTGAAAYAADHNVSRLAHGYIITSTIARGAITGMDTDAAAHAPGVLSIYTPFNPLGLFTYNREQNDEIHAPLRDVNVRYHGQAIGFVVAETFEQARDAATLVAVQYDTQPPKASFVDSLGDATPPPSGTPTVDILAPEFATIDEALAASEIVVTATYTTPCNNHAAMEPHATVATWAGENLTIFTVSQGVRLRPRPKLSVLTTRPDSGGRARHSCPAPACRNALKGPFETLNVPNGPFRAVAGAGGSPSALDRISGQRSKDSRHLGVCSAVAMAVAGHAPLQWRSVVVRVADVGVGAVGEHPPYACHSAVSRRRVQG
jgi:hypothetical protein